MSLIQSYLNTRGYPESWNSIFQQSLDEFRDIDEIIDDDIHQGYRIVPDHNNIFKVFELVPVNNVRVVIVGQDPYPEILPDGRPLATGLAFSIPRDVTNIPKSLYNIFKELVFEYPNYKIPTHGDLTYWATQGVFLLNSSLTVRAGSPGSHGDIWIGFIYRTLIGLLNNNPKPIFLLWGKKANQFYDIISGKATVLSAGHPSPYSFRYFYGCNHFKLVNQYLITINQPEIDWSLP
jgi:uracil-DNA glycosylase